MSLVDPVSQANRHLEELPTKSVVQTRPSSPLLENVIPLPSAALSEADQLRQELEQARHQLQQQQLQIEALTQQLQASQRRQAQLDQDLCEAQQDTHRSQRRLNEVEAVCQDLRSRLYRQQHQTYHFKAALENIQAQANPIAPVPINLNIMADRSIKVAVATATAAATVVPPSEKRKSTAVDLPRFTRR